MSRRMQPLKNKYRGKYLADFSYDEIKKDNVFLVVQQMLLDLPFEEAEYEIIKVFSSIDSIFNQYNMDTWLNDRVAVLKPKINKIQN